VHKSDIATVLALGSAALIAVGDVFQQHSAHHVTDEPVGHIGLLLRLLKDRQWWLGSALAAAGFALQAAALSLSSVLLVQALLVTSLLFALPLSARYAGRRITRAQWMWAVVLAAAVTVVVTVGNPSKGQARGSWDIWVWVLGLGIPLLAAAIAISRLRSGTPVAAVLLGLAAGSLWGVFAVLTKSVVDQLGGGMWGLLRLPELWAWIAVSLTATTLQQSSFRAGSMAASLPAVTVSEPLVGSTLGIIVLGEVLRPGDSGWAWLALAIVAMVLAMVMLARGEAISGGANSRPQLDHSV
jgi:drug/metabolite transporter (DMT)-like permease